MANWRTIPENPITTTDGLHEVWGGFGRGDWRLLATYQRDDEESRDAVMDFLKKSYAEQEGEGIRFFFQVGLTDGSACSCGWVDGAPATTGTGNKGDPRMTIFGVLRPFARMTSDGGWHVSTTKVPAFGFLAKHGLSE